MKSHIGLVLVLGAAIVLALAVAAQGAEAAVDRRMVLNAAPAELGGVPKYVGQSVRLGHTDEMTHTNYLPIALNNYFPPYLDDFSDSNSGWYVYDDGNIKWSYQSGEYEIMLRGDGWWAWASTPVLFPENYIVEADMRRYSGNVGYGLIFGLEDGNHFYLLAVYPETQYFYLVKRGDDGWSTFDYGFSSHISSSSYATNHLKVKRDGNQISAYINGYLVATESDTSYTGMLQGGLYAESGPNTPAIVRFDDFQAASVETVTAVGEGFSSRGMGSSAAEWSAPVRSR
jgi:hypothetical protein